jgi:cytochrome c-type biogenesis protein CcmH/NrfF
MRAEVKQKLADGVGKEAILAGFVDRFGLIVLSAPPTSGFHLTAWIMPFVVLIAGAWVAKRVLGSWKRQTAETRGESPDKPGKNAAKVTDEQQARIERELQDF